MFVCTNLDIGEYPSVQTRKLLSSDHSYAEFKMNVPFMLEYISMRPDNPLEYFTMSSIMPDRFYHASLSKKEVGSVLEKASLHRHAYYELMFVISGNLYQIIENERHLYTPGSCCLLNRNVLHTEEHETVYDVAFIGITESVLADVYRDLNDGFFKVEKERQDTELDLFIRESLSAKDPYAKKYIDFIPKEGNRDMVLKTGQVFDIISDELLSPRVGSTHRIKLQIAKLLHILSDPENYVTKPIRIGTDSENLIYDEIDQIMRQTNGRASRSFLEEELHYSGDYLNKITKKYTGLNIHDFGMTICMAEAARQLYATNKTIGDIALDLGFSNRTHFYKQFEKIYHTSPAEYRKSYLNGTR